MTSLNRIFQDQSSTSAPHASTKPSFGSWSKGLSQIKKTPLWQLLTRGTARFSDWLDWQFPQRVRKREGRQAEQQIKRAKKTADQLTAKLKSIHGQMEHPNPTGPSVALLDTELESMKSSASAEQSEHTSNVDYLEMYSETARVRLDSVDKASCVQPPCLSCSIMDAMTAVVSEVLSRQFRDGLGWWYVEKHLSELRQATSACKDRREEETKQRDFAEERRKEELERWKLGCNWSKAGDDSLPSFPRPPPPPPPATSSS